MNALFTYIVLCTIFFDGKIRFPKEKVEMTKEQAERFSSGSLELVATEEPPADPPPPPADPFAEQREGWLFLTKVDKSMTVPELKAFAEARELEVDADLNKAELIDAINEALAPNPDENPEADSE